jgi:hypothetical protein
MAVGAAHFPFRHRVVARQAKLTAHIGVTLKTHRFFRTRRVSNQPGAKAPCGWTSGGETERRLYLAARF